MKITIELHYCKCLFARAMIDPICISMMMNDDDAFVVSLKYIYMMMKMMMVMIMMMTWAIYFDVWYRKEDLINYV